jgi:hypothetical protein
MPKKFESEEARRAAQQRLIETNPLARVIAEFLASPRPTLELVFAHPGEQVGKVKFVEMPGWNDEKFYYSVYTLCDRAGWLGHEIYKVARRGRSVFLVKDEEGMKLIPPTKFGRKKES